MVAVRDVLTDSSLASMRRRAVHAYVRWEVSKVWYTHCRAQQAIRQLGLVVLLPHYRFLS